MWGIFSGVFGAIGSLFSYFGKRSDLNNTEEMKKATTQQKEAATQDADRGAISNADESYLKDNLS